MASEDPASGPGTPKRQLLRWVITLDAFSAQIQAISYERNEEIVSSDSGKAESAKAM